MANVDPKSVDLRYKKIPKDERTFLVLSAPCVLGLKSFRFVYVLRRSCAFTWIGLKLKEDDAGDRESDGKKKRERGKSGRPSKTGRTGFSGRVGESLYSVSLFLYARLCVACTLESALDTSTALCNRKRALRIY